MAALNFPPSPALNDIFTSGDRSWIFNGTAWQLRPRTTDNIAEGTTNLYYTDARVAAAPAVTALQTDLASEVSARETAISTEQTARAAAVTAEETRALAAEAQIATDLATEVSARELAISTEQAARAAAVSAEETRATGVEAQLRSDLTSEIANRETAVSSEATARETAISAERSARESAVSSLNTRVDNVLSNVDEVALNSLTEIVAEFQSADQSLNGAITSLAASASTALDTERDDRIAADDAINWTVSTLTDSIPSRVRDAVLTGISFAANAAISAGDSVLAAFGKLQAQVTAAFSAIDTEVSDRQSEVSRLDGRVDTEISDRQGEISRVDGRIDTEISDRQSDVQSVRDSLGTIAGQNANNVNITGGTITGVTLNAQSMEVGQGQTADLYVGNDGKVGIGTEAPTEKLTVNGNIDMLNNRIKNLAHGVDSTDAATKGQVDAKADIIDTNAGDHVVAGAKYLWDFANATTTLEINDSNVIFYPSVTDEFRKYAQTNFSNALDLQKKLVVSDTAPEHIDGREWLDTTDFRRYISITGSWVESITA